LRAKGLSEKAVIARLKQAHEKDVAYDSGRILCSMCTSPHLTAKLAHEMFLDSNLGDPGLFPGSLQLEQEAISALAELLHGKNNVGFIVSGGTEANLLALLAARNKAGVESPEVVVPESAHFSFSKVCNLLKLKIIPASLNSSFTVDPAAVTRRISKNTVAIVANAGSAELGTIDPVEEISEIAVKHGVYLHVDAAFGGLVIPFLKELGYAVSNFDFRLKGVQSITVDPHKMGMSTVPAGGILFRDRSLLEHIKTETPYLTEDSQYTFVGTRSGASAAATWAAFESLGREGLKKTVKRCMEMTTILSSRLEALSFEVLLRPTMNIVAFRSLNSKLLASRLRQRGWFVSYVPRLDCIRVILMPHSTRQHVEAFLKCLGELRQNQILQ
jgi:tyrosine decarboxylase/aspartate 1-decarboxylase